MDDEYTYLTMTVGARAGTNFLLNPRISNRIGRGSDCEIVLVDPICSRVHAELNRDEDGWWLRDADSRNGTFVDDKRVGRVQLQEGCHLRMGETEFTFHSSNDPPTSEVGRDSEMTHTVVRETSIVSQDTSQHLLTALENAEFAHDLLVLYQLSLKLLGCPDPDAVVRIALDLLYERTGSSVVGFLWLNDQGQLRPKAALPVDGGDDVSLSESLTNVVCEQGRAVWVSNPAGAGAEGTLRRYADAMCVPLVRSKAILGVLHLYLKQGRFRQADFDFAISIANLLVAALVRAREQASLAAEHARLVASSAGFDELIGESEPMVVLKSKISRVARASGCVLIRGESGAGKELVARALHKASSRADRPLLSVNCAAIPAELIESQLFGHKKGAFTSAESDHSGWFQQADTGTLFLDEIGELPLAGQAKLLRILEGHPFLPVGATKEVTVDVRVLAATNRDLKEFVRERKFREDLYYRLSVFELNVPPLRERGGDIELLVDHFLIHFRNKHGRPDLILDSAARRKLLAYGWPGNVRQLRNVIDSAVVLAVGGVIQADDLGLQAPGFGAGDEVDSLRIVDWEKRLIQTALQRTQGKVPDAAGLLGIGRATLYRKLDEYQIPR